MDTTKDPTPAVAARLLADLDRLVDRLGEAYRTEVPEYAALRPEQMSEEVLPVSRALVTTFLESMVAGAVPHVDDVPFLQSMGRRRLEMGVPLEPMLHVYRVAGRVVWSGLAEVVYTGEERVLATIGATWMDFIDRASSVAAAGYLEASHERLRRLDARRGALLGALLAATDDTDLAALSAEFNLPLADAYVPVLIAGTDVAGRIDRIAGSEPGTVTGFRGQHVAVLVPDRAPDPSRWRQERGVDVVSIGEPAAPGPALAAELRHTDEVLTAALRHGRRGVFGPDDLVVERLITADRRAASVLRRTVADPVRSQGRDGLLEETLVAFLETGSIPKTAEAVRVHANTVSYRLRRVTDLTGLDARVPVQAAVLALALLIPDDES